MISRSASDVLLTPLPGKKDKNALALVAVDEYHLIPIDSQWGASVPLSVSQTNAIQELLEHIRSTSQKNNASAPFAPSL